MIKILELLNWNMIIENPPLTPFCCQGDLKGVVKDSPKTIENKGILYYNISNNIIHSIFSHSNIN